MASVETIGREVCSGGWVEYGCPSCGEAWAVKVHDGAPVDPKRTECPTEGCDGVGRAL